MSTLSPTAFVAATGIDPADVLTLLEKGVLKARIVETGLAIVIEEEDLSRFPGLGTAELPLIPTNLRPLIEEVIATELLRTIDEVLPIALERVSEWESSPQSRGGGNIE